MTFYSGLANTAERLLKSKGTVVTVTRKTPGAYNPLTASTTATEETWHGSGLAIDYELREIDGTLVLQGDRRVFVAPRLGTAPIPTDKLTFDGVTYSVIRSKPFSPAGTVLYYDVQVRA